jgi:DNA-binding beta-propeller fold protein YncE
MMLLRRTMMTALPFAGLTLPAFAAAGRKLAMVMNSGEASVSIIDMDSRQVLNTVPTLREPSHWALSPDRAKLYIADASGNSLFILDPETGAPLGHRVIADPYQLGYTPDDKYLVVNALRLNHVDVYDAATLALVKRFSPGSMPSHLDFSPDGKWAFCSCQGGDTLFSFDIGTLAPRWTVKVGPTPAGVLWLNGKVLVAIMGSDHVVEVDPSTGTLGRRVVTGKGAHNLFLTEDAATLYVSNRLGGSLTALDPATLAVRRSYTLPGGPDDIGIAPDGKLWVALRFAETVAVLDPATGAYDSIPVGRSPHGIFLNTELRKPGRLTAEAL